MNEIDELFERLKREKRAKRQEFHDLSPMFREALLNGDYRQAEGMFEQWVKRPHHTLLPDVPQFVVINLERETFDHPTYYGSIRYSREFAEKALARLSVRGVYEIREALQDRSYMEFKSEKDLGEASYSVVLTEAAYEFFDRVLR